ncbi:MAG: C4-type zinc ribbon domain-containing protein [Bacteroidetes bacterium]|jgi:predicted  nucleic acid-binding Zn-ribbon protein|nr:C4-type zinc ribbon domain-containing protein [Bacteroidota bacterium]
MSLKAKKDEKSDIPVEEKLRALYDLQQIDSQIDRIRTVRGELPLEVRDLEDEVAGLDTRSNNLHEEIKKLEDAITEKKNVIKDAGIAIKKYEAQQGKVRNNREFDSLTKEIEFQNLEIQLSEKRIKEYKAQIAAKNEMIEGSQAALDERKNDLKLKKEELEDIISETKKEEDELQAHSKVAELKIEGRLLHAYSRVRQNVRNGLAVVPVERDACGGCFNKIPPQRQLDIRMHKKIIVCEHCGRILVDADFLLGNGKPVVQEEVVTKTSRKTAKAK